MFRSLNFYITSVVAFLSVIALVKAQDINTLQVSGVENAMISLNGTWKFSVQENGNFWESNVNTANWKAIRVPGEPAMQQFAVNFDQPVVYKKTFRIPADFRGKRIFIRFDGVYSYARLWVNGKYLRDHQGGFTRWEADITDAVLPGKDCVITVEVTDKKDDISYASGYAKHCIGGILRDVSLYTLPEDRLNNMLVQTELDSTFSHGVLRLNVSGSIKTKATVKFALTDPTGHLMTLKDSVLQLTHLQPENQYQLAVEKPLTWDAEHPHLYTLQTALWVDGKKLYEFSKRIGFRTVKVVGNQLLVNGKPVKLRGACHHDMHPLLGRVSTDEYDKRDVQLAKEANMNFIRTSHYPPTQRFVEYCNEMGIYVESETAVCFVNTHRTPEFDEVTSTENSTAYTKNYLSQLEEMVSTLGNEPAVIFWSIGNESLYGTNFQQSYDWLKQHDKTRPVIFSYPGTVPEGKKTYDLLSMHYPKYTGVMNQYGLNIADFNHNKTPVLFDEWAHVPCYVNDVLREDPNIREFWGQSLDLMWQGVFEAKGGLGGAIWGMIDETFMLPDTSVGYGEWGIVDTWRRKKPEFWSTRKAYSPIRTLETQIRDFIPGEELQIPVYNRFDHTALDEITLTLNYEGKTDSLICPLILPHNNGLITLPAHNWEPGDQILLNYSRNHVLIDQDLITLGEKPAPKDAFIPNGSVKVSETDDSVVIQGLNFYFPFSKQNGLLKDAKVDGKVLIQSGPYLNFSATETSVDTNWTLAKISHSSHQGYATVHISGHLQNTQVQFTIRINGKGDMAVHYAVDHLPGKLVKESGVKFILPELVNKLQWERESYWSYYPKADFGAPQGEVSLYSKAIPLTYRSQPESEWSLDDKNFYYFGLSGNDNARPLTNIAKSMKENIRNYRLLHDDETVIEVMSAAAKTACRVNRNALGKLILYVDTRWDYPDISWGDYSKNIPVQPHTGNIYLRFTN